MDVEEDTEVTAGHDDIDEDIKLLKTVLQDDDGQDSESDGELHIFDQNEEEHVSLASASRPSTSTDFTVSSFPTTSMGTEADDLVYKIDHTSINPETCLAMNRAYQDVLLDTLRQIEMSLEENRTRQKQLTDCLDENYKKPTKGTNTSDKTTKFRLNTPFFSDGDEIPPYNSDVQQKINMQEGKQQVKPKSGWPKKDRQKLLNAIKTDALEQLVRPILNKLEVESSKMKDCKSAEEISAAKSKVETLHNELKLKQQTPAEQLLKVVDSDRIDYLKISVIIFNGKYSCQECEAIWRNVLHPSINREDWTKEEDDNLVALVKEHNLKNWKTIAEQLGTNRTPFQCLQHFQINSIVYDTSEWTQEEDELLKEVLEICKYGTGKVQWSQVAYYIDSRSAGQCMIRWRKINPEAKRGRWSNTEDCLLVSAVQKFGIVDWSRISNTVPGRSAIQCRDRYLNSICASKKVWSYEEDKKLLKLFGQHKKFVTVALYMEGRTEAALEDRYKQLKQWQQEWNIFCSLSRKIQEESTSTNFKLSDGGEIVSHKLIHVWAQQEKARGVPEANIDVEKKSLMKYFKQKNYNRDYDESRWLMYAQQNHICEEDYIKQEQDRLQGDTIVPRPPPIKPKGVFCSRMELQKLKITNLLEEQIEKSINKLMTNKDSSKKDTVMSDISKAVKPMFDEESRRQFVEKKAKELLGKHGAGRRLSSFSVRKILKIVKGEVSSAFSVGTRRSNRQKRTIKKKKEIWEEDSPEEDLELEDDEEEEEEGNEDEIEDEEADESEKVPLTTEQWHRREKIREKHSKQRSATNMIREVIKSKLPQNQRTPGRKKVFHMFPQHILQKTKSMSEEEQNKQQYKCLALLMKSFDLSTKDVYKNARAAKRNSSARALLLSSSKTRNPRQATFRNRPKCNYNELTENAELLLEVQNETGIQEDDDADEEDADKEVEELEDNQVEIKMEVDDEGKVHQAKPQSKLYEEYNKCLPYIPPNLMNLRAMKTLLLEHSCMVERAGRYFDRNELRDKLYSMKNKGSNLLMKVIGSMKGLRRERPQKMDANERSTKALEQDVVKYVRKTRNYQQLRARFQAAFSWPALLSTISPSNASIDTPDYILNIRRQNAKLRAEIDKQSKKQNTEKPKRRSDSPVPGTSNDFDRKPEVGTDTKDDITDEDMTLDESIKQVVYMLGNDSVGEEEEAAINKIVDRVMSVYKQRREEKKKHKKVPVVKNKKRLTPAMLSAVDYRERMKVLKRLNLYEKYMQIQRNKRKEPEEKPILADPDAPRRAGRPVGAKTASYNPPNENTRKSARQKVLMAKAQQLEVYEDCGFSPKAGKLIKQPDDPYVYTKKEMKLLKKKNTVKKSKLKSAANIVIKSEKIAVDYEPNTENGNIVTAEELTNMDLMDVKARVEQSTNTGNTEELTYMALKDVNARVEQPANPVIFIERSQSRKRKMDRTEQVNTETSEPKKTKTSETKTSASNVLETGRIQDKVANDHDFKKLDKVANVSDVTTQDKVPIVGDVLTPDGGVQGQEKQLTASDFIPKQSGVSNGKGAINFISTDSRICSDTDKVDGVVEHFQLKTSKLVDNTIISSRSQITNNPDNTSEMVSIDNSTQTLEMVQNETQSTETIEPVNSENREPDQPHGITPVLIGLPLSMGDTKQTAWLPVFPDKDGNLLRDEDGNIVIPKPIVTLRQPNGQSQ